MTHSSAETKYPVMEIFHSLQGEGFHTGSSAAFIRLGGCDVGCVWCDVKDSWDASAHPQLSISEIIQKIDTWSFDFVVITGGEPCMYDLNPLCDQLKNRGFKINLETSGAHPIQGSFDWITLSPKKFKAPLAENLKLAHELKVIVYNNSDFEWGESFRSNLTSNCLLYLQSEWDERDKNYNTIIDYVMAHPEWKLSLQTHKYVEIP